MSRLKAKAAALVTLTAFAVAFAVPVGATVDKITICHKPGEPAEQTLEVPIQAVPGHLGHGDHLGECEAQDDTNGDDTNGDEPNGDDNGDDPTNGDDNGTPDGPTTQGDVIVPAPGVGWAPNCSLAEWQAGTADEVCAPWQRLRFEVTGSDALYHSRVVISGVMPDGQVIDWFALPSSDIGYTAYSPAFIVGQEWTARLYVVTVDRAGEVILTPTSEYGQTGIILGEDGNTNDAATADEGEGDFNDVEIEWTLEQIPQFDTALPYIPPLFGGAAA